MLDGDCHLPEEGKNSCNGARMVKSCSCLKAQLSLANANGGYNRITAASMASKLHLINKGSNKRYGERKQGREGRSKEEMVLLMKPKVMIKDGEDGADQSRERREKK